MSQAADIVEATPADLFGPDDPRRDPTGATIISLVGITAAGAVYLPTLFVCFGTLNALVRRGSTDFSSLFIGLIVTMTLGVLFGGFLSAAAGTLMVFVVALVNWTLGFPWKATTAASVAGGMTAVALTGWLFFLPENGTQSYLESAAIYFAVILAIVLGHVGARYFAQREVDWHERYSPKFLKALQRRPEHQFGIKSILLATAWAAAGLAMMRIAGLLTPRVIGVLLSWSVMQTVLIVGHDWIDSRRN